MRTPDVRRAAAVALLAAAPFMLTAPFAGLHLDDYSFLAMLQGASPGAVWTEFIRYVPGRNMHILFFDALLRATGGSAPAMHLVGVAFDALNAALYFILVRRLTGLRSVALAAAAAFLIAANHGETHFWVNNIPQIQVPAALLLAAFLLASKPGGLIPALAVYSVALFTYDQAFLLWPLLLALAWSKDPRPRRRRYGAAAAAMALLNAGHLAARYLAPYSSGGRPLIRAGDFFARCAQAVYSVLLALFPWPTSSHAHWAWSVPIVLLAVGAGIWLAGAVRDDARREAPVLDAWTKGRAWKACAAAGLAWTALSYGPNLFWYMSPRHHLIPSVGWCLALASAGAYAAARIPGAARWLRGLGVVVFALSAVSGAHEGTQWMDSGRLQDAFAAAVRRVPPPVETLFVLGAPRRLRRAPAFDLPHDVIFAAGRALGRPPLKIGDYEVTPTARGVVYFNDLTLMPASNFQWVPAADANVLLYDQAARRFECVGTLDLDLPDGSARALALRGAASCPERVRMSADAFLASSSPGPRPRGARSLPPVAGLRLVSAEASALGGSTLLKLGWEVDTPPEGPLAFVVRVKNASGETVLDGVFPARGTKRPYPVIWPLVDDSPFLPSLARGRGLAQAFLIRRAPRLEPGAVLELDAYRLQAGGRSLPAGTLAFPLSTN